MAADAAADRVPKHGRRASGGASPAGGRGQERGAHNPGRGAGARHVPEQNVSGKFTRTVAPRAPVVVDKSALDAAGTVGVTAGQGELYGALAPDTGRGGGLEKKSASTNPDDFHHVPGYGGHRPEGWAAHYKRKNFGVHPEGADSKGESHITSWGRPPMASGAAFEGNLRLKEGPPQRNAQGLFKASIEDEIDGIGKSQQKMVGDTCYASLRPERLAGTLGKSSDSCIDGSPKKLDKTLNKDPDGYSQGYAGYNDMALFQGFYPPSRHIPGYGGHVPGGSRT